MARLSFRCDEELVQRVDAERGMIPREAWLRWVVEQALGDGARPESAPVGDGSIPSDPVPAERPYRQANSSQAKRDVQERPKGKR